MSKEGYLQTKISQLEEHLNKAEEKINNILKLVETKNKNITETMELIKPIISKAESVVQDHNNFHKRITKSVDNIHDFHKSHYKRMKSRVVKEINTTLEKLRQTLNFTIIDHTIHPFILEKLLIDKGIIIHSDILKYIEKYHDEFRDASIKELPQESLNLTMRDN